MTKQESLSVKLTRQQTKDVILDITKFLDNAHYDIYELFNAAVDFMSNKERTEFLQFLTEHNGETATLKSLETNGIINLDEITE